MSLALLNNLTAKAGAATAAQPSLAQQARARKAAQEFVASTFIQPLLDQMRKDPFRSKLFHGGQAEDMFSQQLNRKLADRIVASTRLPIVDTVYREILRQPAQAPAALTEPQAAGAYVQAQTAAASTLNLVH